MRVSTAGYHVRLDAATTAATRLLFCTTGILLRRLASDPALARVSHVIVDEVRRHPSNNWHRVSESLHAYELAHVTAFIGSSVPMVHPFEGGRGGRGTCLLPMRFRALSGCQLPKHL